LVWSEAELKGWALIHLSSVVWETCFGCFLSTRKIRSRTGITNKRQEFCGKHNCFLYLPLTEWKENVRSDSWCTWIVIQQAHLSIINFNIHSAKSRSRECLDLRRCQYVRRALT
jgi:hypothetical protein